MDGPLGSAEGGEARELERLRRRAYGRDGDISGDVAAQARLSELEAAQHRQLTPVIDPAPSVPAPVPERVPVAEPVEGPHSTSTSVPQDVDGTPAAPWWRRRWLMILGGATAGLALITVHVALLLQLRADEPTVVPEARHRGEDMALPAPVPDFVLALKSVGADTDEPQDRLGTLDAMGLSANELRQYENFRDFRVWSGESRYGMVCLLVEDQGIREYNGAEGCSPRGLDTVAEVMWFQAGGIDRFVLNGDHVEVYLFTRVADPSDPFKERRPSS